MFKFILTSLLLFIPLFPKFPAIDIPNTYVSVRIEDFLILFSLIYFFPTFYKKAKIIYKNKVARSILIYLFIGFTSLLAGIFLTQTVVFNVGILHFLRRVEYFSLFLIGFTFIKENKDKNIFEYIIKILILVNFIVLMYGLGQRYLNFPVIITQNEEYSKGIALRWVPGAHINSTFAGHYDLASYLVLTVPLFIISFFKKGLNKTSKIVLIMTIASSFWLFSSAVSRISIVAFLVSVSVSLFLLRKYKELLIICFISILAFGFSPDLRARYGRIIEVVKEKISYVGLVYAEDNNVVFEDRSTSIRVNVEWPRAIRAFTKNFLIGTGYSSITLATDNEYLRALGETGILGFVSFGMIFVSMYRYFIRYKLKYGYKTIFLVGFIGSTVGIFITSLFLDIFESSKFAIYYWLFAGIVVGIVTTKRYKKI